MSSYQCERGYMYRSLDVIQHDVNDVIVEDKRGVVDVAQRNPKFLRENTFYQT